MILFKRSLEITTIPTKFCYNLARLSSSHTEKTEQAEENEGNFFFLGYVFIQILN